MVKKATAVKKAAPKKISKGEEGRVSKVLLYFMLFLEVATVAYFVIVKPNLDTTSDALIFITKFSSYLLLTILLVIFVEVLKKQITAKQMLARLLGIFGLLVGFSLTYAIARTILDIFNAS
jgi:hypothetical protein